MRFRILALLVATVLGTPAHAAEPAFIARFEKACVADSPEWKVSSQLRQQADWADRFHCMAQGVPGPSRHMTVEVRPGDGYDKSPNSNASERAEIEMKKTGFVRFDQPVWYRFAFRIEGAWTTGANRTVIHQIKQNIAKQFSLEETPGAPCDSANPFFRLHVREFDGRLALRADVAESAECPSEAGRHLVCPAVPLTPDKWHAVNIALKPSTDPERGSVRVWVDGVACGTYRGRFGYPKYGAQRDGRPYIDTSPRFGIYRDAAPVAQRISFEGIAFWTERPTGEPSWTGIAPPAIE